MPLKLNLWASQAFGGDKFSFTCSNSEWDTVGKQPLKAETLATKPPGTPLPAQLLICVFTGLSLGNVENKGEYLECLFACQFSECFSHFSPSHSDAFVSLLPGNQQKGRPKVGQHSVLALLWLRLCPTEWEPDLFLFGPQQPCRAGRSVLFTGVWREQAPDHGNVAALGHRPYASDSGESLMISTCHGPTMFSFNPSLACPHRSLGIIKVAGRWQEKSRISFPSGQQPSPVIIVNQLYVSCSTLIKRENENIFFSIKRFFEVMFSGWIL